MDVILDKLWWPLVAVLAGSALGWLVLLLTRHVGAGELVVATRRMGDAVRTPAPPVLAPGVVERPLANLPRPAPAAPRPMPAPVPPAPLPGAAAAAPTPPMGMPAWAVREEVAPPPAARPSSAGPPAMPRPQVPAPLPMDAVEPPVPTRQAPPGKLKAPPTNPAPPASSAQNDPQATIYTPPAGWTAAAHGTPWPPAAPAAPARPPSPPTPTPSFAGPPTDGFHEAETVQRLDAPPRPPPSPRPVPRTANMLPRPGAAGDAVTQVARTGANIVIHTPVQPQQQGITMLPHKLEVIYGNFSPSDPKEIPFFYSDRLPQPCRMLLTSAPGESVWHVQLNHFSIFPELHADIVCGRDGTCVLTNRVKRGQEERFQTRVNGAVLVEGENRTLAPGDIISLGIYRLRFA